MRYFRTSVACEAKHIYKDLQAERSMLRRAASLFAVFSLILTMVSCKKETPHASGSVFALDTYITISADGQEAEAAVAAASAKLYRYEEIFSRHVEGGEINRLGDATEAEPILLSDEAYDLLAMTLDYAARTDGIFDPTVAPLMDLWGIGTEYAKVPAESEIEEARNRVDYRKVVVQDDHRAYVAPGTEVDLGGAAKGRIGDLLMTEMRQYDIEKIILDLGGNICVWSKDASESQHALHVGVTDPSNTDLMCAIVTISEEVPMSVITSGAYERYFEAEGVRYGHIMDTRTGYPVKTDLLSATIIDQDGARGDILSTTLYVMGLERAKTWAQDQGVDCILCAENGTLWVSSSLKGRVDAEEGWTIEYFG